MEFSVIMPTLNEIKNIKKIIISLYHQTIQPKEIIIADGGSTDGTYEYLKDEEKNGLVKVIKSGNPSKARNDAIKNTHTNLILCVDAWCEIENTWCENHVTLYKDSTISVAWWSSWIIFNTAFNKQAAPFWTPRNPQCFFFSSRNLSFRKEVREKVWGYPEYLTLSWEDTFFNYKIQHQGYTIEKCSAIVKRWGRQGFLWIYKMHRNYTQGDAEILMIHGIRQSATIRQAPLYLLWILCFIISLYFFTRYALVIVLLWCISYGIRKNKTGLRFWIQYNFFQKLGIIIGFLKGLYTWFLIKRKMKKEHLSYW